MGAFPDPAELEGTSELTCSEAAAGVASFTAVIVPCDFNWKDMAESTNANTAATPSSIHVWPQGDGRLGPVKRLWIRVACIFKRALKH
jgi:hypothetical protein